MGLERERNGIQGSRVISSPCGGSQQSLPEFSESQCPLLAYKDSEHIGGTQTHTQANTHIYKIIFFKISHLFQRLTTTKYIFMQKNRTVMCTKSTVGAGELTGMRIIEMTPIYKHSEKQIIH